MAGFGTRSLPPLRIAEGDSNGDAIFPFTPAAMTAAHGTPASIITLPAQWRPAPLFQPALALQQFWAQASLVTGTTVDFAAGSTPTVEGTPAQADDATGAYIDYSTAATTDTDAGWQGPASHFKTRLCPTVCFSFVPRTAVAACRWWVGLFSADPMASATPAVHLAAFRFDTAVPDAGWKAFVDNGGGTPTQVGSTQSAPVVGTRENMIVSVRPTSQGPAAGTVIEFWRKTGRLENGDRPTLVGVATTDTPTVSTAMRYWIQVRTLANAVKGVGIARVGGFFS